MQVNDANGAEILIAIWGTKTTHLHNVLESCK